jgi:hypothetical protein
MSLVLLVADEPADAVLGRAARLRDRLAARWRVGPLDRALAAGVAPEAGAALVLRAQTLIGAPARRALAQRVERAVRDALGAPAWLASRVAPSRRAVVDAADELDAVVELLREPGPVAAAGVARVALLLGDGCGPLYVDGSPPGLRAAVLEAIAALEVRPTA